MDSVPQTPEKSTPASTPTPGPVASKRESWALSPDALKERREMLERELDEVAKKRDALRSEQLRLVEVKELIKQTELGQEQEELKNSVKDLEDVIRNLGAGIERLSREVVTGRTYEPQTVIPGIPAGPKAPKAPKEKKPSAIARTLALPQDAGPAGETPPPALPPGPTGGPATIDAEIVDPTAEHNRRETLRGLILEILEECPLGVDVLRKEMNEALQDRWASERPVFEVELLPLLRSMVDSGALAYSDVSCAYRLPEPPAPKGKKKAPAKPASKPSKKTPAANGKKGRGAKAVVEPPLPVPAPPTTGHAQRVLRGWIHARLVRFGSLAISELCAEAATYHPELIQATARLLLGCNLAMPSHPSREGKTMWVALKDESGRGVDEAVQDEVCGAMADGPLSAGVVADAIGAPLEVVLDVLSELKTAGRVACVGGLWQQTQGTMAEAAE